MRCIYSTSINPYFNLATEEYFLKNTKEEIFLIYINEPCIVVGKHQNLLSEINLQYVIENKIKLARRISGGGTVYQDLDNVNFSFIHNCTNLEQVSFTIFTDPILEALHEMGLAVEFSGRNDLLIDSKKISGNAMHIFKTRVLSHGTLLYNTDLNKLSLALKNFSQKYIDKSIKSVRSKVTNISSYLENSKSIDEFSHDIYQSIIGKSENPILNPLSEQETTSINQLAKSKFETWEWVYGYSPKYLFQNIIHLSNLIIAFEMQVEKGIIKHVHTNIEATQNSDYQYVFKALLNVKHDYDSLSEILKSDYKINTIPSLNIHEFCMHLF